MSESTQRSHSHRGSEQPGGSQGPPGRGREGFAVEFQFFQMQNFWSSVSRQRQHTERYFKRAQTINCVSRLSYDTTEATWTCGEFCASIEKRKGSGGGHRKVFI